jgi:hypothetical protein
MKSSLTQRLALGMCSLALFALALPVSAKEKIKVFILAGQSNTVGHARGHTIATLYKAGKPGDKELVNLVFKNNDAVSKAFDEQIARAKSIDELTGGISMDKVKKLAGAEKAALEAKVNPLLDAHKAYKKGIIDACTVSDRVYITSIADRNTGAGKLSVGYGADKEKIGPEYGFGLSIAEKVEGPILLIKTSWGGKSITYDFRPPSAPDFKTTKAYAEAKDKSEKNQLRYEEAVKNFPAVKEKYATDLAAYEAEMKTADEKAKKKLRKPKEPRAPRQPKPFAMDNAGHFWREMMTHVNTVLAAPGDYHPDYDAAQGYEVAGFVWFQGYNDQFSSEYYGKYSDNMKLFIKDVRKEFKTPALPFVIGVLGTGMTKEKVDANNVSLAQRAAAQAPEFAGNVRAVESYTQYSHYSYEVFQKGWPAHYHEWDTVGSDRPYHYLGSGAFFVRLGNSFAETMAELMGPKKK